MLSDVVADATEEWRDIAGYEGLYQVSNRGRILSRYTGRRRCDTIKALEVKHGRIWVRLYKDAVRSTFSVPKLVARAFLGPIPSGHEICHRDGDRKNNRVGNLQYVSAELMRPLHDNFNFRSAAAAKFWDRVDSEHPSGCWIWRGSRCVNGYGRMRLPGDETKLLAHRVSYAIHNGPIPSGFFVCHRCDNPFCVNPEHLFLGSQMENMADMVAKCRRYRKLSEVDVCDLRLLRSKTHLTERNLARLFDISRTHVRRLLGTEGYRGWSKVSWPAHTAGKALNLSRSAR